MWRVTIFGLFESFNIKISIHTLRVEGDSLLLFGYVLCVISIHTLRVEGDCQDKSIYGRGVIYISIHTLRVEGDS